MLRSARVHRLLCLLLLTACGRSGFEAMTDAGTADGRAIDTPTGGSYVSLVLSDSPVAYYRLDEAALGDMADATGNGHVARSYVLGGDLTFGMAGALAGDSDPALRVFGEGNLGPANTRAGLSLPESVFVWDGDFTIEGWLKPQRPPVGFDHGFLVWEDYLVSGFRTGWNANLAPRFWTSQGGASSSVVATTTMPEGAWSYLVFTKSGSLLTIYLDGQVIASEAITYVTPPVAIDNCLGSDHGMPSDGVFDEIAIYDRALTAVEVGEHHVAGLAP